jgi:uncharacterized membrane protein YedE/YeeE
MTATQFTPLASTIGGVLIGVAATLLMLSNGRIAGISGIVGRLLPPYRNNDVIGAAAFILGLMTAPLGYTLAVRTSVIQTVSDNVPLMVIAGLLVGIGASYGGGCTSGHGVCGVSRLSQRSVAATAIFMITAFVTVFVTRHILGG